MAAPSLTYTLTNGTTADASQVMQDFNDLLNGITDGTKDLSISALTCAGTATLNGHINLGNSTSDDLTITASLAATLPIKTNTSYDIGSSTKGLASLYLGASSTFTAQVVAATHAASRAYTIPDCGAAASFVMTQLAQSISGVKTFASTVTTSSGINNTDGSNSTPAYSFTNAGTTGLYKFAANSLGFAANGVAAGSISSTGSWTIGNSALDVSHNVANTSTTNTVFSVQNADTTSSSDQRYGISVVKGSTSNTTGTNRFILFAINAGATGSGYIGSNGANAASFSTTSDVRLKENIKSLSGELESILALRPVEFDYKDGSGHQLGFIAQELQAVYPDSISEDPESGMLVVTGWDRTSARIVQAIKELAGRVAALEGA